VKLKLKKIVTVGSVVLTTLAVNAMAAPLPTSTPEQQAQWVADAGWLWSNAFQAVATFMGALW
jgi:hypothetical protein